ncbi:MAG: CCA tRNA nucleotidyltransferase [Fibrobacterota bacterium]
MKKNNPYYRAVTIVKTLQKNGYTAYFAGGYVRDMLRGKDECRDIDIATSARPGEIQALFPRVLSVGESFGVMIVVVDGVPFEVATFRSEESYSNGRHPDSVSFSDPRRDARRRDFTINGMFFDPISRQLYDYVGGQEDLAAGIIKTIGDPFQRFAEDYLRMLRAVRFAARFNFTMEHATYMALKKTAHHIRNISVERIFQELDKMLTGPRPARAVEMLSETKLLGEVLPEVERMKGVEQPPQFHPEGDVFTHTLLVLSHIGPDPSPELAWAALLHDVGKPETQTFEDRIRFNRHNVVGARIARDILHRLRAPKKFTARVVEMAAQHMSFVNVREMRTGKLKRFLGRDTIEDELLLHRADCLASHGNTENYDFLREKLRDFKEEELKPDPLITGKDLIQLGYSPSPRFGEILDAVYDMQLEEKIADYEQAVEWVQKEFK